MMPSTEQHEHVKRQQPNFPILHSQWWAEFAPSLSLARSPFDTAGPIKLEPNINESIRQLIRHEGYVQGSIGEWKLPLNEMAVAIAKLKANGLLPVFALMYDEFWLLARRLGHVVEALLGGAYYLLPDFWAWHIDPQLNERGWRPHRDKGYSSLLSDGLPKSVTLWIPLTAATTLNGCMYIVPADRDPTYATEHDNQWKFQHQDVRALPVLPGEFLIWNQAVLHWGSHASPRGGAARISVAFEFQRADLPAMNQPLLNPNTVLTFAEKLRLIGKQIQQYRHMYPLSDDVQKMVDAMLATDFEIE